MIKLAHNKKEYLLLVRWNLPISTPGASTIEALKYTSCIFKKKLLTVHYRNFIEIKIFRIFSNNEIA